MKKLNVVIIKSSKYGLDGFVERFGKGFMLNAGLKYFESQIPGFIGDTKIIVSTIDEYVHTNLDYLKLLDAKTMGQTLLILIGTQSSQLHRAADLAALAIGRGCMAIIGGPHPMTCDTSMLQGRGVSFSLGEAEGILPGILEDACKGELKPVYGAGQRWTTGVLDSPVLIPPSQDDFERYVIPMAGMYPSRGCPRVCSYCSVIKIAGQRIRGEAIETTIASLRAAKAAGVQLVMYTSDNFNKIPNVTELLNAMIKENVSIPFFCQCDSTIGDPDQRELVKLMAEAKCFDIFVGVETFDKEALRDVKKAQNKPNRYIDIVRECHKYSIDSHFSNIIGFPTDTKKRILENLKMLRKVNPDQVSFYVLTPIPGTEQYDDFMAKGWITEKNMDLFDTTNLVWKHPNLSSKDLKRLLMKSYRKFYTIPQTLRKLKYIKNKPEYNFWGETGYTILYTLFNRWSALKGKHPMSGGIFPKKLDKAGDYAELRKKTFGYELFPLPKSLELSEVDKQFLKNKIAV